MPCHDDLWQPTIARSGSFKNLKEVLTADWKSDAIFHPGVLGVHLCIFRQATNPLSIVLPLGLETQHTQLGLVIVFEGFLKNGIKPNWIYWYVIGKFKCGGVLTYLVRSFVIGLVVEEPLDFRGRSWPVDLTSQCIFFANFEILWDSFNLHFFGAHWNVEKKSML